MISIRAVALFLAALITACFSVQVDAQQETGKLSSGTITGKMYEFDRIGEGIYYATTVNTARNGPSTGGNHPVIVNDSGVMVVDAGSTPAAMQAFLTDLKLITNKPVRWVVNTHFHYDHVDGNQIFGPDVQIIAQDYVYSALAGLLPGDPNLLQREIQVHLSAMTSQIESLKKQLENEKDPAQRAILQDRIAGDQDALVALGNVKPTPPTVTYSSKMTLHLGQREIQLLFLGRGHTQGDTVVFLPKERIVCTGDLMESGISAGVSGIFDEWVLALEKLKALPFDTVLPGHGVPFHGTALITAYQDYLRDLMAQVASLRKQGLTAEETAKKVDLTSHKTDFPQLRGAGVDVATVKRLYDEMDERAKGGNTFSNYSG